MPGLVGSLNHSPERSLRSLRLLAASCPLELGFFIGFSRYAELATALFQALSSGFASTCLCPAPILAQTRSLARAGGNRTLVEQSWLRYHFVFFEFPGDLRRVAPLRRPRRTLPLD